MVSTLSQSQVLQQPLSGSQTQTIVVGAVSLALVAVLTVPAVVAVASNFRRKTKATAELYKDKDGTASEESMAAYSAKIPKTALSVFAIVGFAISTSSAITTTVKQNEVFSLVQSWLNFAQWVSCIVTM